MSEQTAVPEEKKPRSRTPLIIGGVVVVACIGICVIVVALGYFQRTRAERAYEGAQTAFLSGDCDTALEGYAQVLEIDVEEFVEAAGPEMDVCEDFVSARDASGIDSLNGYLTFLETHTSNEALTAQAVANAAELINTNDADDIITQDLCDGLPDWTAAGVVSETRAPDVLFACGNLYIASDNMNDAYAAYSTVVYDYSDSSVAREAANALIGTGLACEQVDSFISDPAPRGLIDPADLLLDCASQAETRGFFGDASRYYQRFLDEFPADERALEVEEALATALIEAARASGAGTISAPQASGSSASGTAVVVIQNDSPERLRLVFSGPETRIEEIDACPTCQNFFGTGPAFCPEEGPIGTYELELGVYDVLVESISDTGTTPFTGNWDLSEPSEFFSCFFVVTTSN